MNFLKTCGSFVVLCAGLMMSANADAARINDPNNSLCTSSYNADICKQVSNGSVSDNSTGCADCGRTCSNGKACPANCDSSMTQGFVSTEGKNTQDEVAKCNSSDLPSSANSNTNDTKGKNYGRYNCSTNGRWSVKQCNPPVCSGKKYTIKTHAYHSTSMAYNPNYNSGVGKSTSFTSMSNSGFKAYTTQNDCNSAKDLKCSDVGNSGTVYWNSCKKSDGKITLGTNMVAN